MDSLVHDRRVGAVALDPGAAAPAPGNGRATVAPSRPVAPSGPLPARSKVWPGLVRGASFAALLLTVAVALHAAITFGLRRIRTSDFGATNDLVAGRINAQVVISGSSRALVQYDPRLIHAATGLTTYNLGRNGSQTDLQLAVLKTYLQHNARPQLVVHNLDLYSFVTSHEIYDPAQYVPYLGEEAIYAGVARVYPDAWKWKYVPLYGYIVPDLRFTWMLGLQRLAGLEPAQDHFDGFVPRRLAWTGDFDKFRRRNPQGLPTPIEPQGVRDLEELLRVCRDAGVPVLLVYSPEYFEIQPLETNRGVIFAMFQRLADRYGARLWDFSGSDISRERNLFYNSQHLNAEGAAVFSLDFGRRLAAAGFVAPDRL